MTTPVTPTAQQAWDAVATEFDTYATPLAISLAGQALGRIDIRPGATFLDVGAGSGAMGIAAGRRGAHVVATDIAPVMIDRLRERVAAEGLDHVEAKVMDADALDFPDDTFDLAGSQNGVTLIPDVPKGVTEMARVTKPGGQVVVATFGPLPQVEFVALFMGAVRAAVPEFPGLPVDAPGTPFRYADSKVLSGVLADAGLRDVTVDPVTWEMPVESSEHLWKVLMGSNPIARVITAGLPAGKVDSVREILDGMVRERSGGSRGAVLTAAVNVAVGTK